MTLKFPAAIAKENNRGTITSTQKAGRTAEAAPKTGGKHKRVEVTATSPSVKIYRRST